MNYISMNLLNNINRTMSDCATGILPETSAEEVHAKNPKDGNESG